MTYIANQTFWSHGTEPDAPNVLVPTGALVECLYSCIYSSDYIVPKTCEEFQITHAKAREVLSDLKYPEMYDTTPSLSVNTFPVEIMKSAPNTMHEQLDREAELDEYFDKLEKSSSPDLDLNFDDKPDCATFRIHGTCKGCLADPCPMDLPY